MMGERCECGYYDWERPHSRPGGGVCKYAYARRTGSMTEFNRDNSATIDRLIRERDEAITEIGRIGAELGRCQAEVEQMRAEILAHLTRQAQCQGEYDERQRDAERYRWLNARAGCITEEPDEECGIVVEMTLCIHTKDGGEQGLLTEWIDAAINNQEKQND